MNIIGNMVWVGTDRRAVRKGLAARPAVAPYRTDAP